MKGTPVAPHEVATAFSTSIEGTWLVKTHRGILSMSLDDLDQAYQRGEVDNATYVFTSGMEAWDTLGHVANLDSGTEDAPEQITEIEDAEIDPEPSEGGSFAPTTTGVFGTDGLPWASIALPDGEGHTAVRRSPSFVPYALRKAAGKVADFHASVRRVHPRLGAVGPWLFGAALSAIFVFSLYQLGNASTPSAKRQSSPVVARTATASERPAPPVVARAAALEPSSTRAPSAESAAAVRPESAAAVRPESAAAAPSEREAPDEQEDDSLATLHTNALNFAKPSRSETQIARSTRGKAKSAKARGAKSSASKKAKARASRKFAKKPSKRRAAAFE
jgi:hypothetical protein